MTLTHRVDKKTGIVHIDVMGSFTMQQIRALIDGVVNDPDFRRGYHTLSDHRRIGDPATSDQVRGTLEHVATHVEALGASKWAVVASKAASYGMMRMMEMLAEELPIEISVFRDLEEARHWLLGSR
jgi:hypothetical protein